MRPGGYEWRYFDALSDEGRYALVIIFFLGSPMSPYYSRIAAGKSDAPTRWQGVSLALHEKREGKWQERAYAYNLYHRGEFARSGQEIRVGDSQIVRTADGWALEVTERGLWRGVVKASATFSPCGAQPRLLPLGSPDGHTWLCLAPYCRVNAAVTLPDGVSLSFTGTGYHDGNFGVLPWPIGTSWYWGRVLAPLPDGDALLYYHVERPNGEPPETTLITRNTAGIWEAETALCDPGDSAAFSPRRDNATGKRTILISPQWTSLTFHTKGNSKKIETAVSDAPLQEGPFYNRWQINGASGDQKTAGIGEVFRPDWLTHPLWRHLMQTRMRRRR